MKDNAYYMKLISEVEKEIREKEELIGKKYPCLGVGKKKKKRIKTITKPHVATFAQQEIERLSKKKDYLLKEMDLLSQYIEAYVPWDWVYFENGLVIITFPNNLNHHYKLAVPKAKHCFNHIRKRLEIVIPPFKIKYWEKREEISLVDTVDFESIIRYLEIETQLKEILTGETTADFESFKISLPDKLDEYYYPPQKSVYINFLCINQCSKYKIIPLKETKTSNGVLVHEDSFLFTLSENSKLCIIWENVNESRASYVFLVSKELYESKTKAIFHYIVNPIRRKRELLHNNKDIQDQLGKFHIVNHTDYKTWKQRIYTYLK
ncbi:hypothetical protein [Bacteroides intestinalis]|uniref:Uncharacterized protein n=1 Tax=Bacteroides intestinalis TaxID=329854 RepID=A0A414L0V4_9BACE|nr:hypothetical protein [Bacteroides intestinalis]RHE88260.1 hypothetical protein DW712_21915 [Bacteroides intestinalis]